MDTAWEIALIMFDFFQKDLYGEVEWACRRSEVWIVVNSILYALLSAFIVIAVLHYGFFLLLPGGAAVLFFLWQIHRLHFTAVLVCREKLLILAPGAWKWEEGWMKALFQPVYFVIGYQEISGFSSDWHEIYLGARVTGGLTSLPVPLVFLSMKDKMLLYDWIEKKQESQGS